MPLSHSDAPAVKSPATVCDLKMDRGVFNIKSVLVSVSFHKCMSLPYLEN